MTFKEIFIHLLCGEQGKYTIAVANKMESSGEVIQPDKGKISQTEDKHTDLTGWNSYNVLEEFLSSRWTGVIDNSWCRKWYSREEVNTDTV